LFSGTLVDPVFYVAELELYLHPRHEECQRCRREEVVSWFLRGYSPRVLPGTVIDEAEDGKLTLRCCVCTSKCSAQVCVSRETYMPSVTVSKVGTWMHQVCRPCETCNEPVMFSGRKPGDVRHQQMCIKCGKCITGEYGESFHIPGGWVHKICVPCIGCGVPGAVMLATGTKRKRSYDVVEHVVPGSKPKTRGFYHTPCFKKAVAAKGGPSRKRAKHSK